MSRINIETRVPLDEGKDIYHNQVAHVLHEFTNTKKFLLPPMPTQMTQAGLTYYRGELPSVPLTNLTDEDLGNLMGLVSGWLGYVQGQVAESELNLLAARKEIEFIEASIRLNCKVDIDGKKLTVQERADVVVADRRYVEANSRLTYCEGMYKLTRAILNTADNTFSAVSRRITQRGQELERERRNQGVGGGTNVQLPHPGQPMFGHVNNQQQYPQQPQGFPQYPPQGPYTPQR